jgi:Mg2+-importing ATPase
MSRSTKDFKYYSAQRYKTVLQEFKTSEKGLTSVAAKKRLEQYGHNVIVQKKELSIVWEFLSHFKNPLIIILIIAAGVSAYLGEHTNAIIIFVMISFSMILDFLEEHNANDAVKKLQAKLKSETTVLRNNKEITVPTSTIVPGDILTLCAGNLVPADARIIMADDFFVNQSALTGESMPNEKTNKKNGQDISPTEMHNLVFGGTSVISGTARAVVIKTGLETEFGKIADKLVKPEAKSEFEIGVAKFGYFVMKIILFLVLAIFLFNTLIHHNFLESFLFAIAIAVGVTPELLPMILSITMASGSKKMAKKGVLVKKLSSISSLGSMNILCTDKTGTLTEDQIVLVKYTDIKNQDSQDVLLYAYLNSFHQTGIKNPLDKAVMNFRKLDIKKYKKKEEIPFDFQRRMMSVVVDDKNQHIMITKGAPEEIFKRCDHYCDQTKCLTFDATAKKVSLKLYHDLSAQGYRVLAVATKHIATTKTKYTHEDENKLELLGFISFLDPAKKDVKIILEELHTAGVEVKIITGDNELVTKKICSDIGLQLKGVMLGTDIEKLTDKALQIQAQKTTVFARCSPDTKNRIISALRAAGNVVGYLGDGINDAPSLKTADVGISVSNAVDVARESADIVLTLKNLEILRDGVMEGRKTFSNTMKYIFMALSSNFGNMFSVLGAVFFLPFLPMLPIQILLNNLIYDTSQVTIPSDNVDKEWIERPRRWDLKLIKKFMLVFGPISSVFDIITFVILFYFFHATAGVFQTAWFVESLATQVLVIHIIRTRRIPFFQSNASKQLLFSTLAAVVLAVVITFTVAGKFFQFTPLPLTILLTIAGLVIIYLMIVEFAKRWFYRKYNF